jgi:hypothetical protein
VLGWEKAWGAPVGRLEPEGGAGQPWTKQEKDAGAAGSTPLSREAPIPQALYFRPNGGRGDGLLANVELRYTGADRVSSRRRPRRCPEA